MPRRTYLLTVVIDDNDNDFHSPYQIEMAVESALAARAPVVSVDAALISVISDEEADAHDEPLAECGDANALGRMIHRSRR